MNQPGNHFHGAAQKIPCQISALSTLFMQQGKAMPNQTGKGNRLCLSGLSMIIQFFLKSVEYTC